MKNKTLPQLILQAQNGNEEAFNELYRRYYKLVRYIAFGLAKNNADTDEIVQEVFIQVQQSIKDLKDPNLFKAWLSRITYSKAKMLFRKNRDHYMEDKYLDILQGKEEERKEFLPQAQHRHQSDLSVLYECMQKLKPYYREVLLLYYFSEMNIKEITDLTQLPEGTVKSRLLYAKKYLREEIEQYEKRSGEAITFRGRSLEAALFALGASLIETPTLLIPFTNLKSSSFTWGVIVKTAVIVLLGGGVIGGVVALSDNTQQEGDSATINQRRFPNIIYQNDEITTPREAYRTLIDFADCDVEMRKKTEDELADIERVYSALMEYGEGYAELLRRRNWDEIFGSYR